MHLKSQMQYKGSFFLLIFSQFLTAFSALASVYFLMQRFHRIDQFSFQEVLLCFAVVLSCLKVSIRRTLLYVP